MTDGERIKKIRKALDLTQQEFADKIGSKRNTVATYEMGRTAPSSAVVSLICREFNVSETWLRTGEGEMFAERSADDELAAMVERLVTGESVEFKRRLVNALSTLKDEHWLLLERKLQEIVGTRDAAPAFAPSHTPTMEKEARAKDEDIEAEVAEYRRQLLLEKEQAAKSQVSQNDTGGNPAKMA